LDGAEEEEEEEEEDDDYDDEAIAPTAHRQPKSHQ